ncbi:MAG: rRNA maturation RNase YbeY [Deltaproteobacteria bacterium]|nr:rRNA maturation RNase YbeY [Deltaproteobacteria bacterium]
MKAKRALEDLGCLDKELSVLFTDDEHMAALNRQYRDKEGPTDVLSFPMTEDLDGEIAPALFEPVMLGDVVVSVETALRDAEELEQSFERTVDRLLIHGILHLLGYDHEKSQVDAMCMTKEEERLMALLEKP